MGGFNIMGSYSGIDMDTIDQMIEAEKSKGVQFKNQKEKIEREQGAWKDVGSRLTSLGKKNDLLQKSSTFQSRKVSSNVKDSSALSVIAGNKAATGKYKIEVNQLATSSKLVGKSISNGFVGKEGQKLMDQKIDTSGTFTFKTDDLGIDKNGDKIATEFNIEIDEGDTLRDIVGKINKETKKSGIEANVIGDQLILTDSNMGDRDITVVADGNDSLAESLGFKNDNLSIPETVEGGEAHPNRGQGSKITVNDITIESDSNQVTDAVDGLTIDLFEEGQTETITVSNDTGKAVDAVKDFVDQYNSVTNFIDKQTDVGSPTEEKNTAGALVGEGSIMRLQSGLRSKLMEAVEIDGEKFDASKFGIEIDRYGVATLDEGVLNEALQEDPTNVARFFYQPESVDLDSAGESGKTNTNTRGVSELVDNFLETYTSKSKGILSTKNDSYDRMVKDINKQVERFDARIEKKRERYIKEFTALDQAMMQAESQMDALYSQMEGN